MRCRKLHLEVAVIKVLGAKRNTYLVVISIELMI